MRILIYALAGGLASVLAMLLALIFKASEKTKGKITLVFGVLSIVLCKSFIIPVYDDWQLSNKMQKVPIYKVLKENNIEEYRQAFDAFKKVKNKDQALKIQEDLIKNLLSKYIKNASDDTVIQYWNINLEELKELQKKDSEICYKHFFHGDVNIRPFVSEDLHNKDMEALSAMITSAIQNPQAAPEDNEKTRSMFLNLFSTIPKKYNNEIKIFFGEAPLNYENKQQACEFSVLFSEAFTKIPKKDSSVLIRWIIAKGTE